MYWNINNYVLMPKTTLKNGPKVLLFFLWRLKKMHYLCKQKNDPKRKTFFKNEIQKFPKTENFFITDIE